MASQVYVRMPVISRSKDIDNVRNITLSCFISNDKIPTMTCREDLDTAVIRGSSEHHERGRGYELREMKAAGHYPPLRLKV